jgi:lysophospholipase L1-like esterase
MTAYEELKTKLSDEDEKLLEQYYHEMFMARIASEKKDKVERYRHLNKLVKPHQILFAGSSLMEQFPIYELLMDYDLPYTIYNRGIGGYTTSELLHNMNVCIYDLNPAYIYLNIGTNDLNGPDYSEARLIERYRNIIEGIYEHLPDVKLYLLAYYPVNPDAADIPFMKETFKFRTNERIRSANRAVEKLAEETGATYIDLNEGITDTDGNLKAEYTIEGMHMYGDGYVPILKALLPYLPESKRA